MIRCSGFVCDRLIPLGFFLCGLFGVGNGGRSFSKKGDPWETETVLYYISLIDVNDGIKLA